jgi:basic membrane protein A
MKKLNKVVFVVVLIAALALLLAACGGQQAATKAPAEEKPAATEAPAEQPAATEAPKSEEGAAGEEKPIKAAWVYVGPIGDGGWTYAHDQGRLYVEKNVPNVETTYIESVPEGADAERVIRDLAQKGYNVIFTTSFGYMDATETVAEEFPDTVFIHISGYKKNDTNFDNLFGRMYQMKYLAGVAAAMKSETGKIGYVAPFPIPEVIRHINMVAKGARSVNPDAEIQVVWINTWFDPPTEREAAETLLNAGNDVIVTGADTPGPVQAASEKGKWGMAYDSANACDNAGDGCIGVPHWNWGPTYAEIIEDVRNGTFKPVGRWPGVESGIVDFKFGPAATDEIKAKVNEIKQAMIDGKFNPADGPINAQSGCLAVKEGETLTDEQLLSMKWFVEGVKGEIPEAQPPCQ